MARIEYGEIMIKVNANEKAVNKNEAALSTAFERLVQDLETYARRYNNLHSTIDLTLKVIEVD